jgi:hypothetical protein
VLRGGECVDQPVERARGERQAEHQRCGKAQLGEYGFEHLVFL